jgi:Raf kinase inhibitor-like YbhB/YbcL family protein
MTKVSYSALPNVPSFHVASESFTNGGTLGPEQLSGVYGVPGGKDISPHLSWNGAPAGTKGYVVTVFDPDASGGFWHWAVVNIPANASSLPGGAGARDGSKLPRGAFHLKNDAGFPGFLGAAAPRGTGKHRYTAEIHAVDVEDLGLKAGEAASALPAALVKHTLARATTTGLFGR